MSIIIFLIILGLLIFVHEFGHFIVAKKSGIRVDEFAIGFPPKLFSWKRGETKYALNLIPFGGYVKIFGENPDEDSLAKGAKDSFVNKNRSVQASVLIAGILFNVLFAWFVFSWSFMIGFDVPKDAFNFVDNSNFKTQIIAIEENSPASRSGLKVGDQMLSLSKNGENFQFTNADQALEKIRNTEAPFILKTNEKEITIDSKLENNGEKVVGFYLNDVVNTKTGFFESFWKGFLMTGYAIKEISIGLKNLIFEAFQGKAKLDNIAGPVGIVSLVKDAAENGFVDLLVFTAFISINLAILNLLPFPALDGGRLLFVLIESITRRNINYKVANILNLVGFFILISLMIIITISDIGKLF